MIVYCLFDMFLFDFKKFNFTSYTILRVDLNEKNRLSSYEYKTLLKSIFNIKFSYQVYMLIISLI